MCVGEAASRVMLFVFFSASALLFVKLLRYNSPGLYTLDELFLQKIKTEPRAPLWFPF